MENPLHMPKLDTVHAADTFTHVMDNERLMNEGEKKKYNCVHFW